MEKSSKIKKHKKKANLSKKRLSNYVFTEIEKLSREIGNKVFNLTQHFQNKRIVHSKLELLKPFDLTS